MKIIVGDIHGNFIKFFEPLKQARIISYYEIYPDPNPPKYKFATDEPIATVIYVGDFIHRGTSNQMYILEALIDICTRYPEHVQFVLGNHEIAECDYYLNQSNFDLFQLSTLCDHIVCKECPDYERIMAMFMEFLRNRSSLLKLEYPEFTVSHTLHFKLAPSDLNAYLLASETFYKNATMVRPRVMKYKLPIFFTNNQKYLEIAKKYKKVNLQNFDVYMKEMKEFVAANYQKYIDYLRESNEDYANLFDDFIHSDLALSSYYEIFKFDLFGPRTEPGLSCTSRMEYPGMQIVGHDKQDEIVCRYNVIYCDSVDNSWLIYDDNTDLDFIGIAKNGELRPLKHKPLKIVQVKDELNDESQMSEKKKDEERVIPKFYVFKMT